MQAEDPWETVSAVIGRRVRRMAVPGGWLYQVEGVHRSRTISADFPDYEIITVRWSQPVFVVAASNPDNPFVYIDSRADDLSITRMNDGWSAPRRRGFLRRALSRAARALGELRSKIRARGWM
jgi:hypothetical protein